MAKKQVILVILDGWGIGQKNEANPVHSTPTPNLDYVKTNFLIGALQASGISVGLPWGEEGNSEVGHLTIGAGKVLYQHYPRITLSIRDGSFAKNRVFLDAFGHVKKNNSALNLAGLLTEGNIHASLEHLIALIDLAKKNKISKINLHIFSDGQDSEVKSILKILKDLNVKINDGINFSSISGRYYALDRDGHWDRTQKTYEIMTGSGPESKNIEEAAKIAYDRNLTDQQIEPRILSKENAINSNDALLFFDFREDRIRQIVSPFVLPDFSEFPVKKLDNLYIGTMTHYSDKFNVPVAYPPEKIENPLGQVLADNGKTQLHIAETEKYAHVTYFFNGFKEQPFPNEYRILIPSEGVSNHAEKPEMQAKEITDRILQAIEEKSFDFVLANYANGDMIAHTGNYDAAKIAIKTIDESVGALVRSALKNNSILIIASDHGNIESMLNIHTGETTTTHDPSPVPIYIVGNEFVKEKSVAETERAEKEVVGVLSDIAPTVLEIMEIPKPKEMTGQNLLRILI
jgi:2,3-bisphosphoglycerate-independent phosphoglycerate mutase